MSFTKCLMQNMYTSIKTTIKASRIPRTSDPRNLEYQESRP